MWLNSQHVERGRGPREIVVKTGEKVSEWSRLMKKDVTTIKWVPYI